MNKRTSIKIFNLPLPYCIVCANSCDLTVQSFSHRKVNELTILAKFTGDFGTIVEYFANKPIELEGNFCRPCAQKFGSVTQVGQLLHLAMVVTIFMTILLTYYLVTTFGTATALVGLGLGLCQAIAVRMFGTYYVNRISPNFQRLTEKEAVLKIPGKGEVRHSWNSVCSHQ